MKDGTVANEDDNLVMIQAVVEATAPAAGRLVMSYLTQNKPLEIETKGPQDFVKAVDKSVELLIRNRLHQAFPHHAIL
ncbi:fructose-1,6-bisphosphatase/inositol monophosphatase family enzyme [Phyllobacterium ifriqiyense]